MNQSKSKKICKTLIFVLIFILVGSWLTSVLQPDWTDWNNYDTTRGFYEQPDNTLETVFLGASIAVNGFTPMELYEDYGICAWNMATEQQPMLASYYWLREAYQYHAQTLKTVILDTSMLRYLPDEAYYEKALLGMRMSSNKLQAIKDISDSSDAFFSYLSSMFAYHTRWKELTESDFQILDHETNTSVRGYNFVTDRVIENYTYNQIGIPSYLPDEEAGILTLADEALFYLNKTVEFCEENGLQLILIKTPGSVSWSDAAHNAVQEIADEYQLTFIDFNYSPYLEEVGYCEATDSVDMRHMNYYGAEKMTQWIGEYLVENCGATDVRGDERYDFLEGELEDYGRNIYSVELNEISDPVEYLNTVNEDGDYTVLISVRDDAANSLTEEQRMGFAELGLTELSGLQFRDSYLAVMENGTVIHEEVDHYEEETEAISEQQETETEAAKRKINDLDTIEESFEYETETQSEEETSYLEYQGKTPDGNLYTLISGGAYLGDLSSCMLEGTEYSSNERGLNIVVYDNKLGKVVDTASFDTCTSSERSVLTSDDVSRASAESGTSSQSLTGLARQLYLYNLRCSDTYEIKALEDQTDAEGLYQCMEAFIREGYRVYLSVKGDAASGLDEELRQAFRDLGLTELSQLEYGDSYLAVIDNGEVLSEVRDHGSTALTESGNGYQIVSGGVDSGNRSSIKINGTEYSPNANGMNVVIHNRNTQLIAASLTFESEESLAE